MTLSQQELAVTWVKDEGLKRRQRGNSEGDIEEDIEGDIEGEWKKQSRRTKEVSSLSRLDVDLNGFSVNKNNKCAMLNCKRLN